MYAQVIQDSINKVFQENNPNATVKMGALADAERLPAVLVQAQSGQHTYDVSELTPDQVAVADQAGALMPIDPSKVPNMKYLRDDLEKNACIPNITSPYVIIYNPKSYDEPITSFKQMFDRKYAKTVGVMTGQPTNYYYAAAAASAGAKPGDDWLSEGKALIHEVGPMFRQYSSPDDLVQGLVSGEIGMTFFTQARYAILPDDQRAMLKTVVPSETTIRATWAFCLLKNATNLDAAYAWLDATIAPSAQLAMAQKFGYQATVTNADFPAELSSAIGVPDEEAVVSPPNWSELAKLIAPINKDWQEYVVSK